MQISPSSFTVADYCNAMLREEITVNREYQRSDKIWPLQAKSFLIETILSGFQIPKLSLHQVTDVKTRKTRKEIVDGQQRSQTIFEFFRNELKLSKSCEIEEAASKTYEQLDPELKQKFLDYSLAVDLFISATSDEIRETFRRINSYNVPLNPEEQRHARYQGEFKWYIYHLAKNLDQSFLSLGTFSEKQLVRMADAKLLCELTHAFIHGIVTTNKRALDSLYANYDDQFPMEKEMRNRIMTSIDFILDIPEIRKSPLVKSYMMYSMILAVAHCREPVKTLFMDVKPKGKIGSRSQIASNLSILADVLQREDDQVDGRFLKFIKACSEKTNVAEQRKERFRWFCSALQPELMR